ncbi:DUF1127 domain-containing protein [Ancylobacter sp. G4_0304]|uniref:DUF1127 domain-containing protein n=1 Tax=Ancylobacter sp. G4_0304 TaxID=3114289 RepID=UPI0039C72483
MQIQQIGIALRTAFERRRAYSQVTDELSAFTDRDLADLGISRHDIPTIAQQAADQVAETAPVVTLPQHVRFPRAA